MQMTGMAVKLSSSKMQKATPQSKQNVILPGFPNRQFGHLSKIPVPHCAISGSVKLFRATLMIFPLKFGSTEGAIVAPALLEPLVGKFALLEPLGASASSKRPLSS